MPSAAAEGVQSVDLNGDKAQLLHFDKARGRLGGGFIFLIFTPTWEDSHFDSYCSNGLVQPPTRKIRAKLGLRVSTHSKKESDF